MGKGPLTRADKYVKKTDRIFLIIGIIFFLLFIFAGLLLTAGKKEERPIATIENTGIGAETDIDIAAQEVPNDVEFDNPEEEERPITLSPEELNMGQIVLGNEASNVLTIGTNGKREIRILSVELEDAPFDGFSFDATNCINKELRGKLTCMVTTRWVPTMAANVQSNFKIVWHETNVSAHHAKHDEVTVRGSAVTKENCSYCDTGTGTASAEEIAEGSLRNAIGPDGRVIGTIDENGVVHDSNGREIGRVTADGLIVDQEGNIIGVAGNGKLIFDDNGNVIGYVDSNGVAHDNDGNVIGKMLSDGRIVDSDGRIIGNAADYGMVRDMYGNIIGRALADGTVVDNDGNVIGRLDANGNVINNAGEIIGYIAKTGEVVTDENGNIIGISMPNGDIVNQDGDVVGHMGLDGEITWEEKIGKRGGQVKLAYDSEGNVIGYIDQDNNVRDFDNNIVGKVDSEGNIIGKDGQIIGRVSEDWRDLAIDEYGEVFGYIDENNMVRDISGAIIGYVDSEGNIIGNKPKITVVGTIGDLIKLIVNDVGQIIGYIDKDGIAHALNGSIIGHVDELGNVIDDEGNIIGYQRDLAVDSQGNAIGYIDAEGTAYNIDGEIIGHMDENNNIIDDKGNIIGRKGEMRIALDKDNQMVGFVDEKGIARGLDGTYIGRDDGNGQIVRRDYSGAIIGHVGEMKDIIVNADGKVIGFIDNDGIAYNFAGAVIGHVDDNGNIVDNNGNIIGTNGGKAAMAYNLKGKVMGYVDKDGLVRDEYRILGIADVAGNVRTLGQRVVGGIIDKTLLPITPSGELLGTINNRGEVVNQQRVVGKMLPNGLVIDTSGSKILAKGVKPGYIVNWGCDFSLQLGKDGIIRHEGKETDYKVYPDGTVWTPDGVFAGRTITTGSVYDDKCSYIGEVSADGYIRASDNVEIGCLNPDGTVLDLEKPRVKGHLARRGFVLSAETWKPMGILDESGLLRNEQGESIGCADSYGDVYDADSAYIGKISDAEYAYGFDGKNLGKIDQAGYITLPDGRVGYVSVNNLIMDRNNRIHGYALPAVNVFADSSGRIIGRLFADGMVYDRNGTLVDNINSGEVGYYNGVVAKNIRPYYVVDTQGNTLGRVNYDLSVVDYKGARVGKINAKGQMFDEGGRLVGGIVKQGSVRSYNGGFLGYVVSTGKVVELENTVDGSDRKYHRGEITGRVVPDGHIIANDKIVGEVLPESVMIDVFGNPIGISNSLGMIIGNNRKEIAAILPGGGNNNNLVSMHSGAVINATGEVIGTATPNGEYLDTKHIVSGKSTPDGKVISSSGKFLGEIVSGDIVIGNDDTIRGVVGFDGRVFYNDVFVGKILTDGLAVDNQNNIMGHVYIIGNTILSNSGEYLGRLSANGRVVADQNNEIGYLKSNGSFVDVDKNVSGYSLPEVARNRRN